MADDPKKKALVRKPNQEVLAPEDREQLPDRPGGRGIVGTLTTGLMSAFRTRTIVKQKGEAKAIADLYQEQNRAATSYEGLGRQVGRLYDLDNILEEDQSQRDEERRRNQRAREDAAIEDDVRRQQLTQKLQDQQQAQWTAERAHEREREAADSDARRERTEAEAKIEHARSRLSQNQRMREVNEAIKAIVVKREQHKQDAEALKAEAAWLAELKALAGEADSNAHDSELIQETLDGLDELIRRLAADGATDKTIAEVVRLRGTFENRKRRGD